MRLDGSMSVIEELEATGVEVAAPIRVVIERLEEQIALLQAEVRDLRGAWGRTRRTPRVPLAGSARYSSAQAHAAWRQARRTEGASRPPPQPAPRGGTRGDRAATSEGVCSLRGLSGSSRARRDSGPAPGRGASGGAGAGHGVSPAAGALSLLPPHHPRKPAR